MYGVFTFQKKRVGIMIYVATATLLAFILFFPECLSAFAWAEFVYVFCVCGLIDILFRLSRLGYHALAITP